MELISTNMAITSSHPSGPTHKNPGGFAPPEIPKKSKLPGENGNEKVELEDGFQPPTTWVFFSHRFLLFKCGVLLWGKGKKWTARMRFFSTRFGSWVNYDHPKKIDKVFPKRLGCLYSQEIPRDYVTPAIFSQRPTWKGKEIT